MQLKQTVTRIALLLPAPVLTVVLAYLSTTELSEMPIWQWTIIVGTISRTATALSFYWRLLLETDALELDARMSPNAQLSGGGPDGLNWNQSDARRRLQRFVRCHGNPLIMLCKSCSAKFTVTPHGLQR